VSYGFIRDNVAAFPASVMCEVLEVSRSGYCDRASRPESARAAADRALAAEIRTTHTGSRGRYGTPSAGIPPGVPVEPWPASPAGACRAARAWP
jgi:hypothetical protein